VTIYHLALSDTYVGLPVVEHQAALKSTYNYVLVPQVTLIYQHAPVVVTQVTLRNAYVFVISGFCRGVNEICSLLRW
jgi:hypothetical protein